MDRKDVLKSPEYWTAHIQTQLYRCAEDFMSERQMNRKQLAGHLNVSKGYVSQLLGGDYNHRLSKLVELALAFGYIPKLEFVKVDEYISTEEASYEIPANSWKPVAYTQGINVLRTNGCLWEQGTDNDKEAA